MKGARPLEDEEIRSVSTSFTSTFKMRNPSLFMLGVNSDQRGTSMILVVSRHNSIYNS